VSHKTSDYYRKVVDDFKANMAIAFDELLPKWNYRAIPQ